MSSIRGAQKDPPLTRGARLRALLDKPVFLQTLRNLATSSTNPKTTNELREAAKHRRENRDAILEILAAESDETTRRTKDQWIPEFLNIDGNTAEDLAELLVNEKYDGPWILRSDYFETYFRRFKTYPFTVETDSQSMNTQHHFVNCPHQTVCKNEPADDEDIDNDNCKERDFLPPKLFLRLAGFTPIFPAGERDISLLHDIWIEEMYRHCFLTSDREIAVTYSTTFLSAYQSQPSKLPISMKAVLPLWEQILLALRQLANSILELQRLGMVCNSLPILVKTKNGTQSVLK
jgi:hypothetical protein